MSGLLEHAEMAEETRPKAPETRAGKRNEKKQRRKVGVREVAITLVLALAVSMLVRFFVLRIVTVDGMSMAQTLLPSERVAVFMFDYWFDDPRRGDIVLCSYPGHEELFVKRVLAMPGEMVLIRDGVVYVNGRPLPEPYIDRVADEDFGPSMVEPGCYFVMGDNRPESGDSRLASVGALPKENISGRAVFLINTLQPIGRMQP